MVHSLLMPAVDCRETDSMHFQAHFVHCGGLKLLLNVLVDKNFMLQADNSLRRWASSFTCTLYIWRYCIKLCKKIGTYIYSTPFIELWKNCLLFCCHMYNAINGSKMHMLLKMLNICIGQSLSMIRILYWILQEITVSQEIPDLQVSVRD